jgi:threonine dehydrogenase-like Zn-dependent dehydrogenase
MTRRAAVTTGTSIEVRDDLPDPTPGSGQVLVRTIACGICGSDLHALAHPEEMAQFAAMVATGSAGWVRAPSVMPPHSSRSLVPVGHPGPRCFEP